MISPANFIILQIESVNQLTVPNKEQKPDAHKFKFELNFYNQKLDAKNQKKVTITGVEDLSGEGAQLSSDDFNKHLEGLA